MSQMSHLRGRLPTWVIFATLFQLKAQIVSHPPCSAALLIAAQYGDALQIQRSLLSEPATCNDDRGRSPLHLAAKYGQIQAALLLLAAGALMDKDQYGRSPLHESTIAGRENMTNLLLDAGAYIELADNYQKRPMHYAAFKGHVALVNLLLTRGAIIDPRDGDQQTPLHYTSQWDPFLNVSKVLRSRGAALEPEDIVGFTPLHYACFTNQKDSVIYFVSEGANIYGMDRQGWNPLVHAAAEGHTDLVDWLVRDVLSPKTYPTPDPADFVNQDFSGAFFGLPAWLFAVIVICCCSGGIVCPTLIFMRRFSQLRQPYVCDTSDDEIEGFVNEVWVLFNTTKEKTRSMCEEWDKIPAHTLKDLHRAK